MKPLQSSTSAEVKKVITPTTDKSTGSIEKECLVQKDEVAQQPLNNEDILKLQRLAATTKIEASKGQLSNEEILERAQVAMFKVADELAERLDLDKEKLRALLPKPQIMGEGEPYYEMYAGYHQPKTNELKINPKFMTKDFGWTPEGIASHEANHALEATIRTCLGKDSIKHFILSQICSEIMNGHAGYITNDVGFLEPPSIPSREMRRRIAALVCEIVNKPKESNGNVESHIAQIGEDSLEFRKLSNSGVQELDRRLQEIPKEYEQFLSYFHGDKDSALYTLKRYIDANVYRFNFALGSYKALPFMILTIPEEVQKIDLELTPKARTFAMQSTQGFLAYSEGNYKMALANSMGILEKDFPMSYTFAPEEIRCKRFEIKADKGVATTVERNEELEARLQVYDLGERLMELKQKLSTAPKDQSKYSEYVSFHAIAGKRQDIYRDIQFSMLAVINSFSGGIDIIRNNDTDTPEKKKLVQLITKFGEAQGGLTTHLSMKLYNEEEYEKVVQTNSDCLREIANFAKAIPRLEEVTCRLESLIEPAKKADVELKKAQAKLNNNCNHMTLDKDMIDKTVPGNLKLLEEVEKIEKQIADLLPKANISTLTPQFFETSNKATEQSI